MSDDRTARDLIADEAETVDLFGDEGADWGSPVSGRGVCPGGASPVRRRGPGRPKGSKNRSTEEVRKFLLDRYRHPVLGLFDIASTAPEDLAKLLVPLEA